MFALTELLATPIMEAENISARGKSNCKGASRTANRIESANELPIKAELAMRRSPAIASVLAMAMAIGLSIVLTIVSGVAWTQQSAPQAPSARQKAPAQKKQLAKKKPSSRKAHKPVVSAHQLPPQIMPPIPATLMNSAPVKPNVTMESGLLTIDAPNSTLSDVLSGVHKVTGAAIEGASPTERVAVKLGPGDPEQVIAALLRGTPYDYVILGALGRQDVVTRVLLTQASASSSQPAQAASSGAPFPRQAQAPQPAEDGLPDRTPPDDVAMQPAPGGEPDQAAQPAQAQPEQPKTPEQLFKELQQLEQQKPQQR